MHRCSPLQLNIGGFCSEAGDAKEGQSHGQSRGSRPAVLVFTKQVYSMCTHICVYIYIYVYVWSCFSLSLSLFMHISVCTHILPYHMIVF